MVNNNIGQKSKKQSIMQFIAKIFDAKINCNIKNDSLYFLIVSLNKEYRLIKIMA